MGTLLAPQIPKDKLGTDEGVAEEFVDRVPSVLKDAPTDVDTQHEDGESKLQAQSPGNRFATDRSAVGGENKCQRQHRQQTQNSGESPHVIIPPIYLVL